MNGWMIAFTVINAAFFGAFVWLERKAKAELDECYLILAKAVWISEGKS